MRAAAMGGVGLLLLCGPVRGEIHRWVDEAGQTHFGDRPPQTVASEPLQLRINTIDTVEVAPPDATGDGGVARTDPARVVLYGAAWCGVCERAKRYFRARRIPFTEYDVEKSAKGRRDYRRSGGAGYRSSWSASGAWTASQRSTLPHFTGADAVMDHTQRRRAHSLLRSPPGRHMLG
ncbi:MAG: DUF4124 domain-containing protein [Candidatus Sedimenticola endophacoides]